MNAPQVMAGGLGAKGVWLDDYATVPLASHRALMPKVTHSLCGNIWAGCARVNTRPFAWSWHPRHRRRLTAGRNAAGAVNFADINPFVARLFRRCRMTWKSREVAGILAFVSSGFLSLAAGCVAHGDAIELYRLRGVLVDAASNAPLDRAHIFVAPNTEWPRTRPGMLESWTTDQGAFDITATRRSGSVTWIIWPIVDRPTPPGPPGDAVHIEAVWRGRAGAVDVASAEITPRKASDETWMLEIGPVPIALRN